MKLKQLSIFVALLSLIVACAPPAEEIEGVVSFPIKVTDQAGRVVKLEKMPEKIVSLSPGITEIVYALCLEDKLVGVTTYCNYPEAALDKPKVGGFSTVDIEKVVEIQPDLILATHIHLIEVVPGLEGLGFTVLTVYPTTSDELLGSITLVGQCTGEEDEASQLVAELQRRIKAVTDKTTNLTEAERLRVLYIMSYEPVRTVGSDTIGHELIVKAGGVNIAQDLTGYPTLSLEAVIYANPQVIIARSDVGDDLPYQFALTEPRLASVEARINNRVYRINTDLVGRPGPRIVDGLEELARLIHPEIFGSIE